MKQKSFQIFHVYSGFLKRCLVPPSEWKDGPRQLIFWLTVDQEPPSRESFSDVWVRLHNSTGLGDNYSTLEYCLQGGLFTSVYSQVGDDLQTTCKN